MSVCMNMEKQRAGIEVPVSLIVVTLISFGKTKKNYETSECVENFESHWRHSVRLQYFFCADGKFFCLCLKQCGVVVRRLLAE